MASFSRSRSADDLLGLFGHPLIGDLARLAESDDAGNIQRSGTHAALVAAAVDLRDQLHARVLAANVKRADSLGTVKLVGGDRGQVNVVLNHVERNLANRLHRVGVEQHAALVTDRANLADGLQRANLVVGGHDRDQNGLVIDGALRDRRDRCGRPSAPADRSRGSRASPAACKCRAQPCARSPG